ESPTYFGFLQILESLELKALEIPTHPRDGFCLDAFEGALARRRVAACFVVPTVHNPLGGCMPENNKRQLLSLCARHDVPIIEDDAYGDLFFEGERPLPLKALDSGDQVLFCSSF